jgi:glycosyltransferase involved in cell wall biosynthesis
MFLQQRLTDLGIAERVRCHPHLDHPQLAHVLQGLDLFVIPSHQEGLCIAALEAMACGVPVVSTRCGGPEEFVLEGSTGQLVDAEPEAMARAIKAICGERAIQRRLGTGAAAWVREHASPQSARRLFRRELATLQESGVAAFAQAGLVGPGRA